MPTHHICMLTQQYGEVRSGIGIYARNVTSRLVKQGWRVTLLLPEEKISPTLPASVRSIMVPSPDEESAARWISIAKSFGIAVRKLIDTDRPDVIVCTDARECRYLPSDGPPIVGMINDNYAAEAPWQPFSFLGKYPDWLVRWAYYRYARLQEAVAYRKLTAAVCNSNFVARSVRRIYKLPEERIFIVHKSIDHAQMLLDAPPEREPGLILTVGGNPARKGVPSLIDVLPNVRKLIPNARLEIIGENGNAAGLANRARRRGVANAVKFCGRLSHKDVVVAHHRATVFAMPALIEALGLVYLEAAICGTPIIATNNGGASEIFSEPESALFITPGDHKDLENALILLLADADFAANIAENGRHLASAHTVDLMLSETTPIIKWAIESTR